MPELPISKKQLDKLGDRLRDAVEIDRADLDLLEAVLGGYDEALGVVKHHLRSLGFRPTDRLKTTGTIIDKLRRERSSSLKTVQDLAGARVVLVGDLGRQDEAVAGFGERCRAEGLKFVVIDRRIDPRAGYRAVHVVVKVDGIPVEVQFRTDLQNLWAQTFERLADTWGRHIRYGGDPAVDLADAERARLRHSMVSVMMRISEAVAAHEAAGASSGTEAGRLLLSQNESQLRGILTEVAKFVDEEAGSV